MDNLSMDCPVTGEVCPERQEIVKLFHGDAENELIVSPKISYDNPLHPRFDTVKMGLHLRRQHQQVETRGCDGPANSKCGIKEAEPEQSRINKLGKYLSRIVRK